MMPEVGHKETVNCPRWSAAKFTMCLLCGVSSELSKQHETASYGAPGIQTRDQTLQAVM